MADKKISALPSASTPLAGTEVLPIVQGGDTVKVTVANLTAGRAISATQLTLTTGNLIVASGNGIDFSATTEGSGTMTSELLDDYEEGTWTPVFESLGASFTYTEQDGSYTKVGRLVIAQFRLKVNAATGTVTNAVNIAGLPFTSANLSALSSSGVAMGLQNFTGFVVAGTSGNNSTVITLWKQGTTSQPIASDTAGKFLNGTAMYFAA